MRLGKESPVKPRGPTILAIVAVLATFALAFAFLGTGTASAAQLSTDTGFVTSSSMLYTGSSPQVTSNTSETQGTVTSAVLPGDALHPPAVAVGSADVLGTALGTSRGSLSLTADATIMTITDADVGYGLQLHKDQVAFGSNVTTISAATTNNAAIGSTGSLQAVLTNIGINATGIAGMMFATTLALAASARFLGRTRIDFLYGLGRRADYMMSMMGRVTTRAVTSVVEFFGGMSRATTPSALTST